MTHFVWTCHVCGATGAAEDDPAAVLAGVDHHVEDHPFDGESRITVAVAL